MRVLVVENDRVTLLGQIGAALDEAGAELDICRPHAGDPLPAGESGHDAIVVMGGPQNALDDESHAYLPALTALMRRFGEADKSVLGVCLGSQLLARAYGAANHIGTAPEFGWCTIALTGDGAGDPVLSAAAGAFPIFQWHSDTFSLPEGAVRLATNDAAQNQAFRLGRAIYGTQFHFEANREVVEEWVRIFPDHIAGLAPGWLERRAALAAESGPTAEATGLALARAWVATIKAAEARRVA
ncbi:type 1 glutamine amidotransferase [Shinella zoogloeoides]|uniref:type 1 glutamine amidotransferase n=1 Tax=Shinella zoogloeoides TaxID=352475 RepID=UPI0028A7C487|nr:type 1 glutamine amidotransferase [Shinella zoogloeoides]